MCWFREYPCLAGGYANPESRQYWQQSLKSMQDKHPATVVPAIIGNSHFSPAAITFTADYLTRAETALKRVRTHSR
ncbi:hypothetical protein [Morganella morganii]|uniref:hypothetical protein n=1 Tax=Morganella morganii TaxID=582 RepID=UPI001D1052E8|nr:hypothetical protein [Morganella morganii]